ncbi:tetratricopeptide repeat protein [Mesonia aquimarina]|uniref:tetratricopeptide repeat protein n=1 Tax=Mesonia aquimarina TaxID=1504967 RepID=UPI000EF6335D|nr:tetratricopeptide repeat protein [Mesonia aquimarina]
MKKTIIAISLSLVSVMAFAQKKEIRKAEDAVEDGNFQEAKTLLSSIEGQIASEKESRQAEYYLVKGNAYFGPLEGNTSFDDLTKAAQSYKKAIDLGEEKEGEKGLVEVRNKLINTAIKDQESANFTLATKKLHEAYQLNKKDTLYLYYAASSAVNDKDYDTALTYYNQLRKMGYVGQGYEYTAVNKESGEVETFKNENDRDLYVQSGDYIKPEKRKTDSKRGEIIKNIALIYVQKDQEDKALDAIKEARQNSPDDTSLMLVEADLYGKMGDDEKYSALMEKVVAKDPTNANLYYNLGVTTAKMGKKDEAIKYYKKAIKYDPSMINAYINLSTLILSEEREIVDEMNGLGMSKADTKRYDELTEKKNNLYKEALPYLEKAVELEPTDVELNRTLMNIYYQLGENEKAKAIKAKISN